MSDNNKPLVIYHAGCYDGFASAFVAWLYFGEDNVDFYPAYYGTEPPNVKDREVYIIDFSYKPEILEKIYSECEYVTVLDHHKTAMESFGINSNHDISVDYKSHIEFDMNRSGAGMAWDYFFRNKSRPASLNVFYERSLTEDGYPWLIAYVQDRDLWKFKLEDSKQVSAYISTLTFDFNLWQDELLETHPVNAAEIGEVILRKIESYNEEMMKAYMFNVDWRVDRKVTQDNMTEDFISGHDIYWNIPVINAPHIGVSELLNYILEKTKSVIAVAYRYNKNGIWSYSIRGNGTYDVSDIAKQYGGGGHHNAAGFELDHLIFHVKGK